MEAALEDEATRGNLPRPTESVGIESEVCGGEGLQGGGGVIDERDVRVCSCTSSRRYSVNHADNRFIGQYEPAGGTARRGMLDGCTQNTIVNASDNSPESGQDLQTTTPR